MPWEVAMHTPSRWILVTAVLLCALALPCLANEPDRLELRAGEALIRVVPVSPAEAPEGLPEPLQ